MDCSGTTLFFFQRVRVVLILPLMALDNKVKIGSLHPSIPRKPLSLYVENLPSFTQTSDRAEWDFQMPQTCAARKVRKRKAPTLSFDINLPLT